MIKRVFNFGFFLISCFFILAFLPVSETCAMGSGRIPSLSPLPDVKNYTADENIGYRAIIAFEDAFLAVGTEGRIDKISKSGVATRLINQSRVTLNSAIYVEKTIIAVGNTGTILVSKDERTCLTVKSGTDKNINSITLYNGLLIAAADDGLILISENGSNWSTLSLALKGNIVSLSAGSSNCYGVTDKGEIIRTINAIDWEIIDYNAKYAGYNKPCSFTKVLLAGKRIAIIGRHEDNTPVVLLSSLGNVWMERSLNYTDSYDNAQYLESLPNDICYDGTEDQFLLACSNGEIMTLPSCTKCNKLLILSGTDLHGILCSGDSVIIVGDSYYINSISLR